MTIIIGGISGGIIVAVISVWAIMLRIPDFGGFENIKVAESTKIYDRTGKIILYDIHKDIKRTTVPFNQIPRNLKNATIAVEDTNFYGHQGISFFSITRAFITNLRSGEIKQGGSTITQQLIKNTFLTPEQTIVRKIKEVVLALKVEKKYSKDELLNFYLNAISYGSSNYGVEAASQAFFGKSVKDITLAEAAYLAALPKAPTYYSPFGEHRAGAAVSGSGMSTSFSPPTRMPARASSRALSFSASPRRRAWFSPLVPGTGSPSSKPSMSNWA